MKNTKIVQDNIRENEMIMIFGLLKGKDREGVDATTVCGKPFELKSHSKPSVSTARDLGYKHLEKWSKRYWLFGKFVNYEDGHKWQEFYFMAPCHLNEWLLSIRAKLDKSYRITQEVIDTLHRHNFPRHDLLVVEKLMKDGALLNDPNIPASYIRKNGILLNGDYKESLIELTKLYPIPMDAATQKEDEFFIFA